MNLLPNMLYMGMEITSFCPPILVNPVLLMHHVQGGGGGGGGSPFSNFGGFRQEFHFSWG